MRENRALIVVDCLNDFGNPNGSLYVRGAELIVPYINELITKTKQASGMVIAVREFHPANHISFASRFNVPPYTAVNGDVKWPDHGVRNTWGAEYMEGLNTDAFDLEIYKGYEEDRDSYSGFGGNEFVDDKPARTLDEVLKDLNVRLLDIVGLATEYCDEATAVDGVNRGYTVRLHTRGIKAVNINPDDGDKAIARIRALGAQIVD